MSGGAVPVAGEMEGAFRSTSLMGSHGLWSGVHGHCELQVGSWGPEATPRFVVLVCSC